MTVPTKTFKEKLEGSVIQRQIRVIGYGHRMSAEAKQILHQTEDEVSKLVIYYVHKIGSLPLGSREARRLLKDYEKEIIGIRVKAWDEIEQLFTNDIKELGLDESKYFARAVEDLSPVVLKLDLPTATQLNQSVVNAPFEGKNVREWVRNSSRADADRIMQRTRIALTQDARKRARTKDGYIDIGKIVRQVVGSKALGGRDGVMNTPKNEVTAIAYTAVNHVQNASMHQVSVANSWLITEEYFRATLDGGTTVECMGYDGEVYPLDEGPIPPLHYRCRSLRMPDINADRLGDRPAKKTTRRLMVAEYAKANKLQNVKDRGDLPRGHKGAFDSYSQKRIRQLAGTVPAKVSYNEFLKDTSKGFQNEALGATRAELFRTGKIHVREFSNEDGILYSIKQLRAKGYSI